MSTTTCCVPSCPRTSRILHRFPKPDKQRFWKTIVFKIWLRRTRNESVDVDDEAAVNEIVRTYRICTDHFTKSCKLPPCNKLKRGSLPTLLLPHFKEEPNEINCQFVELQRCPDAEEIKLFGGYAPIPPPVPIKPIPNNYPKVSPVKRLIVKKPDPAPPEVKAVEELPPPQPPQKPYFKSVKVYLTTDKCLSEVCRICFCTIRDNNFVKLYRDTGTLKENPEKIKDMLKEFLPGLDLEIYENSVICTKCNDSLTSIYDLKVAWAKTEEKLTKIVENELKTQKKLNASLILVAGTPKDKNKIKLTPVKTSTDHDYSFTKTPILRSYLCDKKEVDVAPAKPNIFEVKTPEPEPPEDLFEMPDKFAMVLNRKRETLPKGPFLCDICGQILRERVGLKKHMIRHKMKIEKANQQQRKSMCEVCGDIMDSVPELMKHKQKKHRKVAPKKQTTVVRFRCEICGKLLNNKHSLQNHVRHIHLNIYNYVQCHLCGKQLASRCALNTHLRGHTATKKLACEVCGKKFLRMSGLRKHSRMHDDSKVTCEICGKMVKYESTLRQHIKIFHMKEGKTNCELCGKPYWKKYDMIRHKIKIHGWGPEHERTTEQG